jgi:hypothetical protein
MQLTRISTEVGRHSPDFMAEKDQEKDTALYQDKMVLLSGFQSTRLPADTCLLEHANPGGNSGHQLGVRRKIYQ